MKRKWIKDKICLKHQIPLKKAESFWPSYRIHLICITCLKESMEISEETLEDLLNKFWEANF